MSLGARGCIIDIAVWRWDGRFYFPNRNRYRHDCHESTMPKLLCTNRHLWPRCCFGLARRSLQQGREMGKRFSGSELDNMHKWAAAGISPIWIHTRLQKARVRVRKGGPDVTACAERAAFSNGRGSRRAAVRAFCLQQTYARWTVHASRHDRYRTAI